MAREVERILDAIPAADLAIQWDARYEFAMLDGAIAVWFGDVRAGILERLLRLGRARAAARSSSATTSATATRSTGTSPSRRTPRTSSRSPTRSATASSGR